MDYFTVYLPIAGMYFNLLLLLLIGFTVGVCGGFFGIGGAWIVTPALNIFGFPMPYAIGTDMAHMGGKSIASTIRHGKFGNVDLHLAVSMVIGTTTGAELGARLVMALERANLAESVIRKAYIIFLAFIGCYVLYDYVIHIRKPKNSPAAPPSTGRTVASRLQRIHIPPMIHYPASGITCSLWLPILVGFVTGVVASVLGVGGGLIRMPSLIYLIGCPTAVAVGTDLFEVMITGAYGGFTYALKGRVDLIAAIWMLLGAAVGTQLGAVAVKYVRGYSIRLLFAATIFIACTSVILKQLQMQMASSICILLAAIVISSVIICWLIKGIIGEKSAARVVQHST
jgi:hypothetical protein